MRIIIPAWLALLVAVSLAPLRIKYHLHTTGVLHFAAHFAAFILTAILFCWKPTGFPAKLTWAAGACCAVAILEILEAVIYHNALEWLDVWTGCLGVAVGLVITMIVQRTLSSSDPYENRG